MNNDLISRSALKEELEKYRFAVVGFEGILSIIDNAPTVEIPNARWNCYCEGQKVGYEKALSERPQGDWIEFADFVAKNVVTEDFSEDVDLYAEVLCRKLVKLGLVKLDGDTYKYCGADMRKGGAE